MSSKSGGAKASRKEDGIKVVSDNRRARYDYEILQAFEAGIELKGSEVKSLRTGHTNLAEAYAAMKGGELWLINSNIPEYREANRFNHEPKRPRKPRNPANLTESQLQSQVRALLDRLHHQESFPITEMRLSGPIFTSHGALRASVPVGA